jgi:hypothetical protein
MEEKTRPCEICGEMIDPERVEWQPETRLCTKHAEEMRKYGGEFIVTLTESSAQKSGSIKKAFGDVVVSGKMRNSVGIAKLRAEYEGEGG